MRNIIKPLGVMVLATVIVVSIAYATTGTFAPTGITPTNTYRTLGDIYSKLTNFNLNPSATHSISTTTSPAGSMYTLGDIYGLLTAENTRLTPNNIRNNVTIFGVTGTMTDGTTPPQLAWSNTFYNPNQAPGGSQTGLCWSATFCTAGYDLRGVYNNYGVMIGAKEYCSYLNQAGDTLTNIINDYWRLPTKLELYNELTRLMVIEPNLDELHNRFYASGFGSFRYWSGTAGAPDIVNGISYPRAWRIGSAMRSTPDDVALVMNTSASSVICVH